MKLKLASFIFFLFTFFFGFLLPKAALADTFSLSGRVSDNINNSISDATIDIIDTSNNTNIASIRTDSGGVYSTAINGGIYNIQLTPPPGSNFSPAIALNQNISSNTVLNFVLVQAGTVTLSGHVYDSLGNAASGVQVRMDSSGFSQSRTTDGNGYYSMTAPTGTYSLTYQGSNNTPNLPPVFSITENNYSLTQSTVLDITIPVKKIQIHVQDASGNPRDNIRVETDNNARMFGGQFGGISIGGGITDAAGASDYYQNGLLTNASGDVTLWLLPNSSQVPYSIIARPPSGSIYLVATLSGINVTEDTNLTITLQQPVTLSGHVYDALGNPIEGTLVELNSTDGSTSIVHTTTDTSGSYSLSASTGTYQLVYVRGNTNNIAPDMSVFVRNYTLNQSTVIDMTYPVKRVDVHVQDAAGHPISGVSLTTNSALIQGGLDIGGGITDAGGGNSYTSGPATDASGDATLWLLPAGYTVTATPPSGSVYRAINSGISVTGNTTLTITLQQPVTLSGHVYDALGNPIEGTLVELNSPDGSTSIVHTTTDVSGSYSLSASTGTYLLAYTRGNSSNIPPDAGVFARNYALNQNTVIDMTYPVKRVNVHVQDAAGHPVSGVSLTTNSTLIQGGLDIGGGLTNAGGGGGYDSGSATNASGDAILWLFPAGYTMTATPPSGSVYSPFTLPINVASDQALVISLQYNHGTPVTTINLATQHQDGTYSDPTTVTLSATAATGYTIPNGNTFYTVDGGPQQSYTSPFTVSGSGDHNIEYWSIDNSGVQESHHTKTFTIFQNLAPVVGAITAPTAPVVVNTQINASANFTDGNSGDTHTAVWNWGDGFTSPGNVTESNGSGSVSGSHVYLTTGVYTVTLTVTDNSNASGTSVFKYVSVYNPTPQGLFSGGSHFQSPAGAYVANPSLTGTVKFGVTAKYQNNQATGNVSMEFKTANLEFTATNVSILVTASGKATLHGTGTINGAGNYNVLVTGIQGSNTIRFQITDTANNVIYDSQLGADLTADPTTAVTGHITVH